MLQANVERLVRKYGETLQQLEIYRNANDKQHEELVRSNAELAELQKKYKALQMAHALSAYSEDRENAKRRITAIINKIDQTLEILKSEDFTADPPVVDPSAETPSAESTSQE